MKKIISALILICYVCSFCAFAKDADFELAAYSGTCGKNLTWVLDDAGTLTISGSGDMDNYFYSQPPWKSYRFNINEIVIENGVTSIGESAFGYCYNLTSITIPDSVETIGMWAISRCENLTSVTIPDSVKTIGYAVFKQCPSLESINVSENNAHYTSENGILFDKDKTKLIVYPEGKSENEYIIPDSVTIIGDYAFSSCASLTNITIQNNVKSIGDCAFENCDGITSITIPDSVESIIGLAFKYCDKLISINVSENNAYYTSENGVLFDKNKTKLIMYLEGKNESEYSIPDGVTSIGEFAFSNCKSLKSVIIPDSVENIKGYAFSFCSNLKIINIGSNLKNFSTYTVFENCKSLENLNISKDNAYYTSENGVLFNKNKTKLIKYPAGKSENEYIIPDSVTSIENYAADYCSSLTSITIPDSVKSIGDWAFSYCENLTAITIPDSVETIGEYAFVWCESISNVSIGNGVKTIGLGAFENCYSLTNITIPGNVRSIGYAAFECCYALRNVIIKSGVETIGEHAFLDCTNLTSITMLGSVTTIGNYAFYNCSSLNTVYYTGTEDMWRNISIGYNNECLINAERIFVISGTCGKNLIWFLDDKGTLTISGSGDMYDYESTSEIPWYSYRSNINKIDIGNNVESIGNYAFYSCDNLSSVTIGNVVTNIGDNAFSNCNSLKNVYYGGTEDMWRNISIGYNNECLINAEKIFVIASGTCGEKLTWLLDDKGTLAISGSGNMYDYTSYSKVPWYSSHSSIKKIVIENGVTSIGDYAFYFCSSLTSITIPDSVTSIGKRAFYYCSNLKSITIPDGVTTIGVYAFSNCNSLSSVTIGNSVTTIGDYAFYWCSSLTSITIPDSVTTIGECAFYYCDSLSKVTIGNSIKTISDYTFYGCSSLKTITIPDSVTSVGSRAFYYCNSLKTVYYCGTEDQWKSIAIGSSNDKLTNADLRCIKTSDGGIDFYIDFEGDTSAGTVYAAMYNSDKSLKSLVTYPASLKVKITVPANQTGDLLKIMWWDEYNSPKCDSKVFYIK